MKVLTSCRRPHQHRGTLAPVLQAPLPLLEDDGHSATPSQPCLARITIAPIYIQAPHLYGRLYLQGRTFILDDIHAAMSEFLRATHWDELIRSKPLAAALGLFSHYVLNNGEWDNSSHLVLSSWVLTFAGLVAFEYAADPRVTSILGALQVAGTAAAVYLGTLIASILVYRAFFHRLRKVRAP